MIEAIKNRTMAQAWRLLWQHKILWLYVLIFPVLFYPTTDLIFKLSRIINVPFPDEFSLSLVALVLFAMAVLILFMCIVQTIIKAAFYVNAFSRIENKRTSFVESFKLGSRFRTLIFWAVIVGLVLFLHDLIMSFLTVGANDILPAGTYLLLPLFGMKISAIKVVYGGPVFFRIIHLLNKLLNPLFLVATIYVTIVLATSYVSVGAAIKKSFSFVCQTWLSLLGVFGELVSYHLLVSAINILVLLVLGTPLTLHMVLDAGTIRLNYLFLKSFIYAPLWFASIVVLYKRQLMREQNDTRDQIPHNPF